MEEQIANALNNHTTDANKHSVTRPVKLPSNAKTKIVVGLKSSAQLSFSLLLVLALSTPSWRYGTFSWLPIKQVPIFAGGPINLGVFNLLPLVTLIAWFSYRLLAVKWQMRRMMKWRWGRLGVTVPLFCLSMIGLLSLDLISPRRTFIHFGALALAWFVYLFLINEKPPIILPLAIILLIQGSVATLQFLAQSDIGLSAFGELSLNPSFQGATVLWARDKPWLRAYGLTAHPNLLGALLAALLILFIPYMFSNSKPKPLWLSICFFAGFIGLITSFSRAAALAFIVGFIVWFLLERKNHRLLISGTHLSELFVQPKVIIPVLGAAMFLILYSDLILSRIVGLNTDIELRSLTQRLGDATLALQIIAEHPIRGVGLGNYTFFALRLSDVAAIVHNVPLLVTAELGFVGLFFFVWLTISGLRSRPAGVAPWIAVIIIGIFDTTLWLTSNWQSALMFGVIAANLSVSVIARQKPVVGNESIA